jgi:hypothetical protein
MVYKETQRKGAYLRCPSCKNETPFTEQAPADAQNGAKTAPANPEQPA